MPYRSAIDAPVPVPRMVVEAASNEWCRLLPTLRASQVGLRRLRLSDAASLLALLATEEVARFISPPPTTKEGFERFIRWSRQQQMAGRYICFALTTRSVENAIGIFQVRGLEHGWLRAEWGFALASSFWGTGVFAAGAELVLDFAFETVGVHRLEARASVRNARGNGALRKIGAVQEGVLRKSFVRDGEAHDQCLWTILADEFREKHRRKSGSVTH